MLPRHSAGGGRLRGSAAVCEDPELRKVLSGHMMLDPDACCRYALRDVRFAGQ